MTLNQLLVINISLYIMSDMNVRYARVSPISPPISDMKNPHPIRSRYLIFWTLIPNKQKYPNSLTLPPQTGAQMLIMPNLLQRLVKYLLNKIFLTKN